jgi:peptidoglycan hydrolase CwlO-like protein
MSQLSSWIDESLILIGKDETDKVRTLSLKIGVYLDFVEASVARDKAMGDAMEAESKLKALKAEYGKLEAQVQQLTAEEEVLQAKLNSMQK